MEDWKIHRDRARCAKPGCPLAAERSFYAILKLPECIRIERCEACFAELSREQETLPFHWKVRRDLDGRQQPVLDLESLRTLFDTLGEAPAESNEESGTDAEEAARSREGLRYLVALLLLRKRRLKMVDPVDEEQERADLVVVDPKVPEMAPVALFAPELAPERLENLREELTAALGESSRAGT